MALTIAVRRSLAPVLASAATVVLGLCCLLLADINATRSLGAVCAVGVACAAVSMLVTLPVLLGLTGAGVLRRSAAVARPGGRPLGTRVGTVADLVQSDRARLGLRRPGARRSGPWVDDHRPRHDVRQPFRDPPGSVRGQAIVDRHFTSGATAPAMVLADASSADTVGSTLMRRRESPRSAGRDRRRPGAASGGAGRRARLRGRGGHGGPVRDRLSGLPDADALVGGPTAKLVDVDDASSADLRIGCRASSLVVFLALLLLLRAVVASALLLATVVLTYPALGMGSLALRASGSRRST